MNRKRFCIMIVWVAAMLSVTSCNKGCDQPEDGLRTELRLSSGVEMQSRAAFTGADTQISDGEAIVVYVDETGGAPLYEKNMLTADGNGGMSGGVKMFFPENGRNADIYALHTNAVLASNAYPAAALTHTVRTDQRTLANYAASDLLYARTNNVAKTTTAVPLTFFHLLSKVQIAIKPGNGLTSAEITGITVGGIQIQAVFTLDKATAPNAIGVMVAGSATDIAIGADITEDFASAQYNDAIIVPQTVAANTALIVVHLTTGDLIYRLPADVTFTSGKRYIYQITANLAGLNLVSSIVDWTPINPVTGNATLE